MICAGEFNRFITIEANSPSQDAYGEPIESWSTHATAWAQRLSQKATERFATDQFAGFDVSAWKTHYLSTVDTGMRVLHEGVYYDIEGVEELGYKESMVLITKARKV